MFARGFKTWCENASIGFRQDLGLAPAAPLVPRALASELGIQVWRADEVPGVDANSLHVLLEKDPSSWSALTLSVGQQRVIIINNAHSAARSASDIVHELSHIILGHEPARIHVSENGLLMLQSFVKAQEEEANWLGGCLLLPRNALLHIKRLGWNNNEAARQYGVSEDMVSYRMQVTGVNIQSARSRSMKRGTS